MTNLRLKACEKTREERQLQAEEAKSKLGSFSSESRMFECWFVGLLV